MRISPWFVSPHDVKVSIMLRKMVFEALRQHSHGAMLNLR
jgi:hypothetical protein